GAMTLNDGRPVETGDAAGHLGVAHALIGHLRAFGFNASQGRIFLPWDVFAICGVAEGEVLAGQQSDGIAVALTRLSETAAEHLRKADVAISALPRNLRAIFAPRAVLAAQLKRIDPDAAFARVDDLPDWRKIALLTWARLRG
ncbi:MAG: squalene/phytoene synthase family protein, partial [Devosia sp.]